MTRKKTMILTLQEKKAGVSGSPRSPSTTIRVRSPPTGPGWTSALYMRVEHRLRGSLRRYARRVQEGANRKSQIADRETS